MFSRDSFLVFLKPPAPQLTAVPGMMRGWNGISLPPAFTKRNHLARGGKKIEKENKRDILDQLKSMGKRAGLGREKKGTSGSSSASMGEQWLLNKPHTPPTLPNSPLGGRCSTAIFKMPAEHPPPCARWMGWEQGADMVCFDPVFSSLFPLSIWLQPFEVC